MLPLLERASQHGELPAITDQEGTYTYRELLVAAQQISAHLLRDIDDLEEAAVAFMVPPGLDYAAVQWGIWQAGGVALPLCISHPPPELEYVIKDSDTQVVIAHPNYHDVLHPITTTQNIPLHLTSEIDRSERSSFPRLNVDRRAMILYTSGTTGKPRGVVSTHHNITIQITTLVEAWQWTQNDRILHVLPLHHTHGIVNALLCALWAGANCEFLPGFEAVEVWDRFINKDFTLFMAVPTIYSKLTSRWEKASPQERDRMSKSCSKLRLMVSGSAALPIDMFEKWHHISGHRLLERYGMTEIGMALSNPLQGERRPGSVGLPLPGVQVRLTDESNQVITAANQMGEIQVKGPGIFKEYLGRPEATKKAFLDGWFRTGDEAKLENGYYRILGRSSVDIIKTGGHKISALEIEEVFRTHPLIEECAVVGIPDEEWGERVCSALILGSDVSSVPDDLRRWGKERLAPYKVPTEFLTVTEFPRNAMGKVIKPTIRGWFQSHRSG
ncbi:MAG: acyl-CoA synthetase [Acidobacteriota bacterium]